MNIIFKEKSGVLKDLVGRRKNVNRVYKRIVKRARNHTDFFAFL